MLVMNTGPDHFSSDQTLATRSQRPTTTGEGLSIYCVIYFTILQGGGVSQDPKFVLRNICSYYEPTLFAFAPGIILPRREEILLQNIAVLPQLPDHFGHLVHLHLC